MRTPGHFSVSYYVHINLKQQDLVVVCLWIQQKDTERVKIPPKMYFECLIGV